MVSKCSSIKKQGTQEMILFTVELFAKIKCFRFYIKPSSGQLYVMLYPLSYI